MLQLNASAKAAEVHMVQLRLKLGKMGKKASGKNVFDT
jgi:hypothetical protein